MVTQSKKIRRAAVLKPPVPSPYILYGQGKDANDRPCYPVQTDMSLHPSLVRKLHHPGFIGTPLGRRIVDLGGMFTVKDKWLELPRPLFSDLQKSNLDLISKPGCCAVGLNMVSRPHAYLVEQTNCVVYNCHGVTIGDLLEVVLKLMHQVDATKLSGQIAEVVSLVAVLEW
jgi:hypothetical protein